MKRSHGPKKSKPRNAVRPPGWDVPGVAYLYGDPSSSTLRVAEIAQFLRKALGFRCVVRGEFFAEHGGRDFEALARGIAGTKVRNLGHPFEESEPSYGEIQFELRLLREPTKRVPGILYDGFRYAELLRGLLPSSERSLRVLHVAFAHRLLGTFDEDGRYHARAVIASYPSVVSTSGIVEAPAKPEDYYKVKARLSMALGTVPFDAAKEPFEGQFIDYDDPRLTEVAKGYALQAAMYHVTKEAFCDLPTCRLFNAHWQAELIAAQLESGRMCARHEGTARRIRGLARGRKG